MTDIPIRHDGKLGDGYIVHYDRVCVGMDSKHKWKFTQGVHIATDDDVAVLTPKQALSLLAWLRQEESELQRLAKEVDEP